MAIGVQVERPPRAAEPMAAVAGRLGCRTVHQQRGPRVAVRDVARHVEADEVRATQDLLDWRVRLDVYAVLPVVERDRGAKSCSTAAGVQVAAAARGERQNGVRGTDLAMHGVLGQRL